MNPMNTRSYRTFQALILAALGIFLLAKVMDGRVLLYINQRFVLLVFFAAVGMIILAQLALRERPGAANMDAPPEHAGHSHAEAGDRQGWVLWLVALPVLIGLLAPERPLGASALSSRGMNITSRIAPSEVAQIIEVPSTQRSVLDWIRLFGDAEDPSIYEEQEADVTGFVYHDARLGENQFMAGRFTITCCVADAVALGMIVEWPAAASLPDNQWVRVRGPVQTVVIEGKSIPSILAREIEIVPQPELPYLFQ